MLMARIIWSQPFLDVKNFYGGIATMNNEVKLDPAFLKEMLLKSMYMKGTINEETYKKAVKAQKGVRK